MQVLDEQKRLKILAAAAELFAIHPFHKVLLSDVAEAAGVGKGTLYTYFDNKDDLYLSVLYTGFAQLVGRIRNQLDQFQLDPMANLEAAVGELVQFAYQNPHMFELMRTASWRDTVGVGIARWKSRYRELKSLIESIIRRGIDAGDMVDPHPELTARFITGMARAALTEPDLGITPQTLTDHILNFLRAGLASAAN